MCIDIPHKAIIVTNIVTILLYFVCDRNDLRSDENYFQTTNGTVLHEACMYGRLEIVKLLLEKGTTCRFPSQLLTLCSFFS